MPRRVFLADLQRVSNHSGVDGISRVSPGRNDGEFIVTVQPKSGKPFELFITIPEIAEYPEAHWLQIEPVDRNIPDHVKQTLSSIQDSCIGKSIDELLYEIAAYFVSDEDAEDGNDVFDEEIDGAFHGSFHDAFHGSQTTTSFPLDGPSHSTLTASQRNRIRYDLRTAKEAGFRVGVPGGSSWLFGGGCCYLSLSVRISDLGISHEAQKAWQIKPYEYLILLIQYPNGYRTFEEIIDTAAGAIPSKVAFQVGKSNSYKPSIQEAIDAFAKLTKKRNGETNGQVYASMLTPSTGFQSVFISRPLNELMNERFVNICKYRMSGMPWSGAERYMDLMQASLAKVGEHDTVMDHFLEDRDKPNASYPSIVVGDHITDNMPGFPISLPLLATQYLLRHFVRCTEFCLVCHNQLDNGLESIMPYVCERGLCLHQFMTLGFGLSIEHEIKIGPHVVDLLISFCYVSCREGKLSDFPKGLNWQVPPLGSLQPLSVLPPAPSNFLFQPTPLNTKSKKEQLPPSPPHQLLWFDINNQEMMFHSGVVNPVKPGDWIAIKGGSGRLPTDWMHCRVTDAMCFPSVKVSKPISEPLPADPYAQLNIGFGPGLAPFPVQPYTAQPYTAQPYTPQPYVVPQYSQNPSNTTLAPPNSRITSPTFYKYDHNFEALPEPEQREMLCHLLNTLPDVQTMNNWLTANPHSTLADWRDRISPAALGALRWVVASCRACIMQETSDERVFGMPGWMQFRFAMGAPDKERRFINSVQQKQAQLNLKVPTLFAWHGSPLHNWHSIIRLGLHFKDTVHGRSFGNGCYHSMDFSTSASYSHVSASYAQTGWPLSKLRISSALALNEIINAPAEFVSRSPHLVVAQLDWIQTRYLFVQCRGDIMDPTQKESPPLFARQQDPMMTPKGVKCPIIIPDYSSRAVKSGTSRHKKFRASGSHLDPIILDEVETDDEDQILLVPEEEPKHTMTLAHSASRTGKDKEQLTKYVPPPKPTNLTPFAPGKLEYSSLPILAPPIWATSIATKRLMSDFQNLVQIQEYEGLRGRLHELGWYTNPERIENVYQWIVELHSFEDKLPLSQDMKRANIQSVVLELRFGKDYPMSPPFVRVVRPRFLPFAEGGGGNVTLGGAMCMELLTNTGWSAASTIESVLLQVRCAITATDPRPARLDGKRQTYSDYGVGEAVEAYERACRTHGWQVPPGFREMAFGGTQKPGAGGFKFF